MPGDLTGNWWQGLPSRGICGFVCAGPLVIRPHSHSSMDCCTGVLSLAGGGLFYEEGFDD